MSNYLDTADQQTRNNFYRLAQVPAGAVAYDNNAGLEWLNKLAINRFYQLVTLLGDPNSYDPSQGGGAVWYDVKSNSGCAGSYYIVEVRDTAVYHAKPVDHLDFLFTGIKMELDKDIDDALRNVSGSMYYYPNGKITYAVCGELEANLASLAIVKMLQERRINVTQASSLYDTLVKSTLDEFFVAETKSMLYEAGVNQWPKRNALENYLFNCGSNPVAGIEQAFGISAPAPGSAARSTVSVALQPSASTSIRPTVVPPSVTTTPTVKTPGRRGSPGEDALTKLIDKVSKGQGVDVSPTKAGGARPTKDIPPTARSKKVMVPLSVTVQTPLGARQIPLNVVSNNAETYDEYMNELARLDPSNAATYEQAKREFRVLKAAKDAGKQAKTPSKTQAPALNTIAAPIKINVPAPTLGQQPLPGTVQVPRLGSPPRLNVQMPQVPRVGSPPGVTATPMPRVTSPGTVQMPRVTSPGTVQMPRVTSPGTVQAPRITSPGTVQAPRITSPGTVQLPRVTSPGTTTMQLPRVSSPPRVTSPGTVQLPRVTSPNATAMQLPRVSSPPRSMISNQLPVLNQVQAPRVTSPRSPPRMSGSPTVNTVRLPQPSSSSPPRVGSPPQLGAPRLGSPRVGSPPRLGAPRLGSPPQLGAPRVGSPPRVSPPNAPIKPSLTSSQRQEQRTGSPSFSTPTLNFPQFNTMGTVNGSSISPNGSAGRRSASPPRLSGSLSPRGLSPRNAELAATQPLSPRAQSALSNIQI